eukprot:7115117-Alexandrium_andersonii.AAC.1
MCIRDSASRSAHKPPATSCKFLLAASRSVRKPVAGSSCRLLLSRAASCSSAAASNPQGRFGGR